MTPQYSKTKPCPTARTFNSQDTCGLLTERDEVMIAGAGDWPRSFSVFMDRDEVEVYRLSINTQKKNNNKKIITIMEKEHYFLARQSG